MFYNVIFTGRSICKDPFFHCMQNLGKAMFFCFKRIASFPFSLKCIQFILGWCVYVCVWSGGWGGGGGGGGGAIESRESNIDNVVLNDILSDSKIEHGVL